MSDRIIIAVALAPAAYMFIRHIIDVFNGRA
jgi:hypothetical protein